MAPLAVSSEHPIRRWLIVGVLVWTALLVASAASVRAQGDEIDVPPEAVSEVARQLNCPICQGYNLQDCPLEVCAQMRELIREQLAAGESVEAIKASFVDEYGPQVLNTPPTEGWFIGAWVLPVLVLLAGAVLVAAVVWRGAHRAGRDAPATSTEEGRPSSTSEYTERLEDMIHADDA